MRASLLQELGIQPTEVFEEVLTAAVRIQVLRGEDGPLWRSFILYAAMRLDALVRAVFEVSGLRIRTFEHLLGLAVRPAIEIGPRSEVEIEIGVYAREALQDYRQKWPERALDPAGFAAAVLGRRDGDVHERLRTAGVDLAEAARQFDEILSVSPDAPWISSELAFRASRLTGDIIQNAANRIFEQNIALGFTVSSIFLAAVQTPAHPLASPSFLRNFIARTVEGESFDAVARDWFTDAPRVQERRSQIDTLSSNVVAVYIRARRIAQKASATSIISARHLIGALIAESQIPSMSGIHPLVRALQINPAQLASEYLNYLEQNSPATGRADHLTAWRHFLGVRDDGLMPRFQPEDLGGVDLLDVMDDVNAFASLIASKWITPPLSIGLFGDWGSGKSFFMAKLREQIDERTKVEGDWYHRKIVHIEFNAWHYVEANLWASLVDHIFNSLHLTAGTGKSEEEQVEDFRRELLEQLDAEMVARAEAELAVRKAEIERDQAAQTLDAKKKALEASTTTAHRLRARDVWDLVKIDPNDHAALKKALDDLGINALLATRTDIRKTYEELGNLGNRGRLLVSWTMQQPRELVLLAILIVLASLGMTAILSLLQPYISSAAGAIAELTTLIGGSVAVAGKHIEKGKGLLKTLDDARNKIEESLKKAEKERTRSIDNADANLSRATAQLVGARVALEEKEEQVRSTKQKLTDLSASRRLVRFIDERAASDDYRKLLGILATVRNDFQKLSLLLDRSLREREKENEPKTEKKKKENEFTDRYGLDRIILYIDDLDRCPPDRVVEVLQAVHLLLAFKLFVVVVGVDARWVSESLRQKNRAFWKKLEDGKEEEEGKLPGYEIQPHDYLEKIFQVPFWLEPLRPTTTATYLRNLLHDDIQRQDPREQPITNAPQQTTGSGPTGAGAAGGGAARGAFFLTTQLQEADATPKQLEIQDREVEFIETDVVAELVGRSPRTAKRFVNTYRFFRAGVPARRLTAFLGDENEVPEYKRVLLLLAIVVGAPDVSVEAFADLTEAAAKTPKIFLPKLAERIKNKHAQEKHQRDWSRVVTALGSIPRARAEDLMEHLPKVARFSFRPPYEEVHPAQRTQPRTGTAGGKKKTARKRAASEDAIVK